MIYKKEIIKESYHYYNETTEYHTFVTKFNNRAPKNLRGNIEIITGHVGDDDNLINSTQLRLTPQTANVLVDMIKETLK